MARKRFTSTSVVQLYGEGQNGIPSKASGFFLLLQDIQMQRLFGYWRGL